MNNNIYKPKRNVPFELRTKSEKLKYVDSCGVEPGMHVQINTQHARTPCLLQLSSAAQQISCRLPIPNMQTSAAHVITCDTWQNTNKNAISNSTLQNK